MNSLALYFISVLGMLTIPSALLAQGSQAFMTPNDHGSAIDAKGIKHTVPTHSGTLAPWMQDCLKCIAPYYPYEDRAQHHTGTGWFRLRLDLQTGTVTQISVLKSTGFATLDNSAIAAFHQSRWKAGRWKEIDVPVNFVMVRSQYWSPPPGAVPLAPH